MFLELMSTVILALVSVVGFVDEQYTVQLPLLSITKERDY